MPRRDPFEANTYYHIYNRWLEHQTIFFSDRDFQQFLRYIHENLEKYKNEIWLVAYCLLPNHFHFVVLNKTEWITLSRFVWNICVSYVRWYKTKHQITTKWQSYFEDRFKSKKLDSEQYLRDCINYVELNAIKHELVDDIQQRAFTSWTGDKEPQKEILSLDWEF